MQQRVQRVVPRVPEPRAGGGVPLGGERRAALALSDLARRVEVAADTGLAATELDEQMRHHLVVGALEVVDLADRLAVDEFAPRNRNA